MEGLNSSFLTYINALTRIFFNQTCQLTDFIVRMSDRSCFHTSERRIDDTSCSIKHALTIFASRISVPFIAP